jgi:hypothetical protein
MVMDATFAYNSDVEWRLKKRTMRMKNNSVGFMASAMLAAVLLSGCATTTHVTSEWRDPDVEKAGPYKNIFVIAVTGKEDIRNQMEDDLSAAITAQGVSAVASHLSVSEEDKLEKAELIKAVKKAGADAVLVVRMVSKENRTDTMTVSSPSQSTSSYHGYYNSSWAGYDAVQYSYDVFYLETKLFDVATEKNVWGVSTESIDPKKIKKAISGFAGIIGKRLGEVGLLGASAP